MGILDRLFGGRFTLTPPEETTVSDAAIMRELHPYRAELKAFTQAILARMPEDERNRIRYSLSLIIPLNEASHVTVGATRPSAKKPGPCSYDPLPSLRYSSWLPARRPQRLNRFAWKA